MWVREKKKRPIPSAYQMHRAKLRAEAEEVRKRIRNENITNFGEKETTNENSNNEM